ncbi:hypothetical protein BKA62DRAFT_101351 [Auriculariales sp. MPI-PUGE-AT-0066]|nr:hypothetical protein BKA62DRAFT_101351 [Auriculariales sp. MPI-PUGE-AT-0066]
MPGPQLCAAAATFAYVVLGPLPIFVDDASKDQSCGSIGGPWTTSFGQDPTLRLWNDTITLSSSQGDKISWAFEGLGTEYWGGSGSDGGPCVVRFDGESQHISCGNKAANGLRSQMFKKMSFNSEADLSVAVVVSPDAAPNLCDLDRLLNAGAAAPVTKSSQQRKVTSSKRSTSTVTTSQARTAIDHYPTKLPPAAIPESYTTQISVEKKHAAESAATESHPAPSSSDQTAAASTTTSSQQQQVTSSTHSTSTFTTWQAESTVTQLPAESSSVAMPESYTVEILVGEKHTTDSTAYESYSATSSSDQTTAASTTTSSQQPQVTVVLSTDTTTTMSGSQTETAVEHRPTESSSVAIPESYTIEILVGEKHTTESAASESYSATSSSDQTTVATSTTSSQQQVTSSTQSTSTVSTSQAESTVTQLPTESSSVAIPESYTIQISVEEQHTTDSAAAESYPTSSSSGQPTAAATTTSLF